MEQMRAKDNECSWKSMATTHGFQRNRDVCDECGRNTNRYGVKQHTKDMDNNEGAQRNWGMNQNMQRKSRKWNDNVLEKGVKMW
jgi:hypothetical protein